MKIESLISDYQATGRILVEQLRQQFDITDVLRAVVTGELPRSGRLDDGTEFFIHGVGCSFESADKKISLDFGPNGRFDGFNAQQLMRFVNDNHLSNEWTFNRIDQALTNLDKEGVVVFPRLEPSPTLGYYVKDLAAASPTSSL